MEPYSEAEKLYGIATWSEFDRRRADAVAELGSKYGEEKTTQQLLVSFATNDRAEDVRLSAIKNIPIDEFDESYIKPILLDIYENDEDEMVRSEALLALSYYRRVDPDVLQIILENAQRGENAIKGAAILALEPEVGSSDAMNNFVFSAIHSALSGNEPRANLIAVSVLRRSFVSIDVIDQYLFSHMNKETPDPKLFYIFSALLDCRPDSKYIVEAVDICLNAPGRFWAAEAALKYISDKPELVNRHRESIFDLAHNAPGQFARRATLIATQLFDDDSELFRFLKRQFERLTSSYDRSIILDHVLSHYSTIQEGRNFLEMVNDRYPEVKLEMRLNSDVK